MNSSTKLEERAMDKFIIRFEEGQRAALKARAAANKRSMNSELLILIEAGIASTKQNAGR